MDSDYPFDIFKLFSNNTIRNFDTLSKFTSELKKINETENHAVPKHYFMVLGIEYYFDPAKKFSFVFEI